jgi:predicted RNase H-related nuclease YkuK (DUF458 family)
MSDKIVPEVFNSPTFGRLEWEEAIAKMIAFMATDTKASYEVIIGTDSEAQNGVADFVSAVVVHKKGKGGIYFWGRIKIDNLYSMRQRIWQEAIISLGVAEKVVADFAAIGLLNNHQFDDLGRINLEIHVDIGPNGETRQMISEIVGMIRANGFKVATKPAAWGASHVADRHV